MKKTATKKDTQIAKNSSKKNPEKVIETNPTIEIKEEQLVVQEQPTKLKSEAISAVDLAMKQLDNEPDVEKVSTPSHVPVEPEVTQEHITVNPEESEFENKKPKMFSSDEELPRIEKTNQKLFLLGIVVFIATVIATVCVGFIILQSVNHAQKEEVRESTQSEVPTATPTVAMVLKREEWKIEVLNGSGIAGGAAKAASKLKELGYEVVKTGNAQVSASQTKVFVSSDKSAEEAKLVLEDLKSEFGELQVDGELKDSTASLRIVLGKQ